MSQQLRLLMSPKLVKAKWEVESAPAVDPQLTYRPPTKIESLGAKPAEAPVSAASFKKSESPLQAVVAAVGSMAILAALYHFGYYEGRQALPEPQQYAAAAPLPATPAPRPDPFRGSAEAELLEKTVAALASPPLEQPVPATRSVAPATPSGLYLQVAALKDSAAARDLESELRTAGFETEMLSPSDDGLIRVLSGPYGERDDARTAAKKMSEWGVQPFLRKF